MKKNICFVLLILILGVSVATPTFAADCNALKKALKKESSLKKKRQMLGNLIIQCPEDPAVNYKYALSLERFRKYDKALVYYQKAIALNPKMGKAFAGMGDVYIYMGMLDDAVNAYDNAQRLMPQNDRARSRLARLEIKKKALTGGIVSVGEFIQVMDHRGKIPTNMPLLLTGPALQYDIAFVRGTTQLLPTGIRQLAAIGQAMQEDALRYVNFEIATYVDSSFPDPTAALAASQKRAEMIKEQLVANFLINPKRISIVWYGGNQPLELGGFNGTLNSRVEIRRLFE